MKIKEVTITAFALAAIAVVSVLAYRSARRPPADVCQICQRSLHHSVTYRFVTATGIERACCPRCGMHFDIQQPGKVIKAWATDLTTGQELPADQAVYVEGGNVEYCTLHQAPFTRGAEGVSTRAYDRCLPTLVAFGTRAEAESYQSKHGGRILDYHQAMESVKEW